MTSFWGNLWKSLGGGYDGRPKQPSKYVKQADSLDQVKKQSLNNNNVLLEVTYKDCPACKKGNVTLDCIYSQYNKNNNNFSIVSLDVDKMSRKG